MLFLERTVTKPFHSANFNFLKHKIDLGYFERSVVPNVIKVIYSKNRFFYVYTRDVNGSMEPVSWLYLMKKTGWAAYEPLQVYTVKEYRRLGLSKKLYITAVNTDGIILMSGKTQTSSSKALWEDFIKNEVFNVFAIDLWNLKKTSDVLFEDGEVWSTLPLYFKQSEVQTSDVRLVGTRKQK
jgi:hypothetical protein